MQLNSLIGFKVKLLGTNKNNNPVTQLQTLAQAVIWPGGEVMQHILASHVSQNNKHFMYNMYNIYYNI